MRKFKVKITETLSKTVVIEAESEKQAEDMVSDKYYSDEIELDYGCLVDTKFEASSD